MRQNLINSIKTITAEELQAADVKFPNFSSPHEGYAVILEEVEELQAEHETCKTYLGYLWNNIKSNHVTLSHLETIETAAINAACEAIQVAAMCRKFIRLMKGD